MKRKDLVIERTFNAPIEEVWAAFTSSEILARWWSPEGMTNCCATCDVREGGEFRYCFKSPDGKEYWGKGVYQTVTAPTYLSYLDNFTDANGTPVAPSHYGIPGTELTSSFIEFRFTRVGAKTHLKMTGENPYDDSLTENMTTGWNSIFDKLVTNFQNSIRPID